MVRHRPLQSRMSTLQAPESKDGQPQIQRRLVSPDLQKNISLIFFFCLTIDYSVFVTLN